MLTAVEDSGIAGRVIYMYIYLFHLNDESICRKKTIIQTYETKFKGIYNLSTLSTCISFISGWSCNRQRVSNI